MISDPIGCRIHGPRTASRAEDRRYHHPDFDKKGLQGWRAAHREGEIPGTAWQAEREWALSPAEIRGLPDLLR